MPETHRRGSTFTAAAIVLWLLLAAAGGDVQAQSSTTNPYRATFGWEQLPDGRVLGTVSGVFPDPDGRHLWIMDRCGANQCAGTDLDPIMKFDLDGNLIDSFGAGLFAFPHGFVLDHDGFLWVTEGGSHGDARATLGESMGMGHQVLKLNQQGDVLMRLGEAAVWGDDERHFNGPSGVVVAPSGEIWVSDGHRGGNNRIVKFSSDGVFLLAVGGGVGSESKEAARFSDPHDIKMDSQGRVYVADRGNSRIQVFDQDGNLLHIWTHYGKTEWTVHRPQRHPLRGRRPVGHGAQRSTRQLAQQSGVGKGNPDRRPQDRAGLGDAFHSAARYGRRRRDRVSRRRFLREHLCWRGAAEKARPVCAVPAAGGGAPLTQRGVRRRRTDQMRGCRRR